MYTCQDNIGPKQGSIYYISSNLISPGLPLQYTFSIQKCVSFYDFHQNTHCAQHEVAKSVLVIHVIS